MLQNTKYVISETFFSANFLASTEETKPMQHTNGHKIMSDYCFL